MTRRRRNLLFLLTSACEQQCHCTIFRTCPPSVSVKLCTPVNKWHWCCWMLFAIFIVYLLDTHTAACMNNKAYAQNNKRIWTPTMFILLYSQLQSTLNYNFTYTVRQVTSARREQICAYHTLLMPSVISTWRIHLVVCNVWMWSYIYANDKPLPLYFFLCTIPTIRYIATHTLYVPTEPEFYCTINARIAKI